VGNPRPSILLGIPSASWDGKYHARYPLGDKPGNAGELALGASTYQGYEGTQVIFAVSRTNGSTGDIAVDWAIEGISQGAPTPSSGTLTWNNGQAGNRSATITLGLVTQSRVGTIVLSNPRTLTGGANPTVVTGDASLTILNDTAPPAAVTLSAVAVSSGTINLTFSGGADTGSGRREFVLWRSLTGSGGWSEISRPTVPGTYSDTGRSSSTQYYYRIEALDVAGNSSGYATANATTHGGGVGTLVHQEEFIVEGANFGTKHGNAPLVWDDGEHEDSFNARYSDVGPTNTGTSHANLAYRAATNESGFVRQIGTSATPITHPSLRGSRIIAGGAAGSSDFYAGWNTFLARSLSVPAGQPYLGFIRWWERADPAWSPGGDDNYKWFDHSYGSNGPTAGNNNHYLSSGESWPGANNRFGGGAAVNASSYSEGNAFRFPDADGQGSQVNLWFGGPSLTQWTLRELWLYGRNDDQGRLWCMHSPIAGDAPTPMTYGRGVAYRGRTDWLQGTSRTFTVGGYQRRYPQPNNWRYFADVFMDVALSEATGWFFLTNSANWATSTIREIQPWGPGGYADGLVSLQCNGGRLPDGPVHLHYRRAPWLGAGHQYLGEFSLGSSSPSVPVPSGDFETESGFTVSGDAEHGSLLTIARSSGSFGSHANYNNQSRSWQGSQHLAFRFADFAGATPGSNTQSAWESATGGLYPHNGGDFTSDNASRQITMQSGGPSQSGRFGRRGYSGSVSNPRLGGWGCRGSSALAGNGMYMCFKYRVPSAPTGGKPFRVYFNEGGANFYLADGSNYGLTAMSESRPCGDFGIMRYAGNAPSRSAWRRVELFFGSTTVECAIDGTVINWSNSSNPTHTAMAAVCSNYTTNGRSIEFPDMIDDAGGGAASYDYADIYINGTSNRFELRKNGIREVQIPDSWSAGSCQIRLNQGAIDNLDGAELYHVTGVNTATHIATVNIGSSGGGSSDLKHDEIATIEGSGFGSVASPARIYDDFSGGSLNAVVRSTPGSGVGNWQTGAGDDLVTRSNIASRGVHSRVARHNLRASGGGYNASLCLNHNFSGSWLFDWWQRVDPVSGAPSFWTRNFKGFRFYMDDGYDSAMVLTWIGPGTNDQTQFYTYVGNPYLNAPLVAGQWRHWRLRWNLGVSYANDAVHLSSAAEGSAFVTHYNGGFRASGSSSRYPYEMRLGHYWAHDGIDGYSSNPGADVFTSSVLVQNTWARVELGNHPTYASATITEAQHTMTRTDSFIEYRVNRGLLLPGLVYEYVFDASNTLIRTTPRTLN